jgi:hypothetical protein
MMFDAIEVKDTSDVVDIVDDEDNDSVDSAVLTMSSMLQAEEKILTRHAILRISHPPLVVLHERLDKCILDLIQCDGHKSVSRIVLPKYLNGRGGSTCTKISDLLHRDLFSSVSTQLNTVLMLISKHPFKLSTYGDPLSIHEEL